LAAEGITVIDGQGPIYEARSIKSADEIAAQRIAMAACDDGF
jgi:Xaa-Pro aminopeptidase